MAKVRVVIADNHILFRSGLRKLLEDKPHLKVVGEAGSVAETLALVKKLKPDILLLDVQLPNLSELDLLRELHSSPATRVILLTKSLEHDEIAQAFRSSARGIVLKNGTTESIFKSIDAVMSGQYWISCRIPELADALTRLPEREGAKKSRRRKFDLTPRELDILKAIAAGDSNRKIAKELSISEQTVKHHVTNIFNKTGASNRLELTLFAIEQKVVYVNRRL